MWSDVLVTPAKPSRAQRVFDRKGKEVNELILVTRTKRDGGDIETPEKVTSQQRNPAYSRLLKDHMDKADASLMVPQSTTVLLPAS